MRRLVRSPVSAPARSSRGHRKSAASLPPASASLASSGQSVQTGRERRREPCCLARLSRARVRSHRRRSRRRPHSPRLSSARSPTQCRTRRWGERRPRRRTPPSSPFQLAALFLCSPRGARRDAFLDVAELPRGPGGSSSRAPAETRGFWVRRSRSACYRECMRSCPRTLT